VRKSRNGITGSFEVEFLPSTDFIPLESNKPNSGNGAAQNNEVLKGFEAVAVGEDRLPF